MMAAVISVALSHAFVGKMPAPVSDPKGGGGGGGGGAVIPWIRHCPLQAIYRSFEGPLVWRVEEGVGEGYNGLYSSA